MADAERSYEQALAEGFNPTGFSAGLANFTDNIPGLSGLGNFIRNDAGDRARQAELQWTDAQLKAMSGAASPEAEVVRNQITNFARPGQNYRYLGDRLRQARATAFQAAKIRAGPAAADVVYPELSLVDQPDSETGLPSYPAIRELTKGAREIPTPEDGYGSGSSVPGSSPEIAIDYTSVPPNELMALLANGGWVRQGNGEPYQVAPGSVRRASADEGDVEVARGVYQRPTDTPEGAVEQRRAMNPLLRRIDAAGRGAADILSMETADEISGFADAALGRGQGRTFAERARNNIAVQRAVDEADRQDTPWSRRTGQAAGIVAALPRVVASGVRNAPRFVRLARTAGEGAAVGAASGFGAAEGTAVERIPNALGGAAIGAVAAPAANALGGRFIDAAQAGGRLLSRNVGRGMTALGVPGGQELIERATPNALTTGIARLNERVRANPEAMRARTEELAAQGIEPTVADLVDDAGRGTLRALATRQTPARTAAREFAEDRAVGLQDRISTQVRRTISDEPRSPDQLRADIGARRSAEADRAFGAVRNEMITPEREVIDALRAPATRTAVEDAAVRASNRGDTEVANGLRQLVDGALDDPNGVQMTIGMADRIARTLNGRGEALLQAGDRDAASSMFRLAERLRTPARQQSQGYNSALEGYAAESRLLEAADLGEQFLRMEADQFAQAMSRLSPDERQVAQAAARRAIERAAGTPGQAPGVAQRLAGGREQGARNAALLDDPAAMETAMRAERDLLMNARAVSPAQGSATNINQQDTMAAAGEAVGALRDAATGNIPGLLGRAVQRIRSRGFSDAEAEEIVMAAIDPARTREVIDRLVEAGVPRQEARTSVRAIRRAATQHAAASSQTPR